MSSAQAWPGELRREPPLTSQTYAVRAPLARWLREQAAAAASEYGSYRVLDVGCGVKPYYPFFEPFVSEYVGVDVVENPAADLQGAVEELPVADGSFEVVLCTQVLEHADDPAQAVRELRRVTAPGGRVLASTHGVYFYHPSPEDLWRWTHTGLERLFTRSAQWTDVEVVPGAGTAACIAMLLAFYLGHGVERTRIPGAAPAVIGTLNRAGRALDRRFRRLREPGPGTIFANYHVTAIA